MITNIMKMEQLKPRTEWEGGQMIKQLKNILDKIKDLFKKKKKKKKKKKRNRPPKLRGF